SESILVMEHELFRHIEIEMFVARSDLTEAMAFTESLLKCLDGDPSAFSQQQQERLLAIGKWELVTEAVGSYTHAYPICIRRVLPDETLISMAADATDSAYAISFISYVRPQDRAGFNRFAGIVCEVMGQLFDARPHWGKVCPVSASEAERLYPQLKDFRRIADNADSAAQFRNAWIDETLFVSSGQGPQEKQPRV
ncbi:MAG: D-arabinono-1,4-lactone oxidase, partial [Rubripirellula sp.]